MKRRTATPFDALLGLQPKRLPGSAGVTVVVAGKPVSDVREIDRRLVDEERDDLAVAEARRLRQAVEKARERAQFQRQRRDPVAAAKRQLREQVDLEARREYLRGWRERNRDHIRAYGTDWARQSYKADPEPKREASRRYYAANREALAARARERQRAKREAARQDKAGAT